MSRSAYAIASTGVDDLYAIQKAFTNLHAIFTVMLNHFPEDSTGHAFAQLGMGEVSDWSGKADDWSDQMENELSEPHLDAEREAYYALCERRWDLKHPDKAKVS